MSPPQVYRSSLQSASQTKKRRHYSEAECLQLMSQCDDLLKSVDEQAQDHELLSFARELSARAGLSMDSDLPTLLRHNTAGTAPLTTTAGHSNTDHRVPWTGNYSIDRTAQLRRELLARNRAQCPENMGEDRWDKPRIPGERRRRIVREKDLPGAPPIPPPTGYIVFLGQMTIKWRHDHPNEPHDQSAVVREISKLWRIALNEEDHKYYNTFADECREEYKKQQMEFRATGVYTPSEVFERPKGAAFWMRKKMEERNNLEKEIAAYDTVLFPVRPPEYEEEYKKRDLDSRNRRKLKVQLEAEERLKIKEQQAKILGLKPPRRRKRRKRGNNNNEDSKPQTDTDGTVSHATSQADTSSNDDEGKE